MKPAIVQITMILVGVLLAFQVEAAKLTGRISVHGGSTSGASVHVKCPSSEDQSAKMDASGSYTISRLPNNQRCKIYIVLNRESSQKVSISLGTGTKVFNGFVRMHKGKPVLIQR